MDAEWGRWRQDNFGDPYMVWHDGPDFTVMVDSARADPETVFRMLRAGLADGDPLAASSFAELAQAGLAPPEAEELLRSVAAEANGELLIRVAQALYALTGDASWAESVVTVLRHDGSEFVRLDAAMALAHFPASAALVAAVAHGVRDPAYLVRYHSANTLLRYAGRRGDVSSDAALFRRVSGDDPGGWESAAADLTRR
ncbi:hypothetical protein BJ973_006066 [Actinoplanes tereljensis]|uniref:hypothetical protein n=1 Tax=Paractinoplanes tereljensis TaxID=571912 RepID=UPI001940C45E|nr:hypothetical protein [Actinoplanes tereljensis]